MTRLRHMVVLYIHVSFIFVSFTSKKQVIHGLFIFIVNTGDDTIQIISVKIQYTVYKLTIH